MNKKKLETYVEMLHKYTIKHKKDIFKFFFDKNKKLNMSVIYVDAYDTDNCLELDDINYDEYYEMLFKPIDKKIDSYIIVNYKNLPYKVLCNDELVYEMVS